MTRKELILHLEDNPSTVRGLALASQQSPAEVNEDLQHIAQSLRHQAFRLVVVPARCRKCGFVFADDRYRKPSKCPQCRGTWLTEPLVSTIRESESSD